MRFDKYFNSLEFDSPDEPGSGEKMDLPFINRLVSARILYGQKMEINSGFRTEKHNKRVGGKDNSAHLRGFAADIRINNSTERLLLIKALLDVGFTRIGVANTFIHVDNDPFLPQNALWKY